jgi:hypothetical protein
MIAAEVQLLDANVQAQISRILELELKYIQNELKSIITAASLIASTVFFAIIMGEPPYEMRNGVRVEHGYRDLDLFDQTAMVGMASLTIVLATMTLCSATFLNLWGANEALRTKTTASLTKAVDEMRRERIITMRIFILTVFFYQMTGIWLCKVFWHPYAFYTGCTIFTAGYFAMYYMYRRTRNLFERAPPIFGLTNEWNSDWLSFGMNDNDEIRTSYVNHDD